MLFLSVSQTIQPLDEEAQLHKAPTEEKGSSFLHWLLHWYNDTIMPVLVLLTGSHIVNCNKKRRQNWTKVGLSGITDSTKPSYSKIKASDHVNCIGSKTARSCSLLHLRRNTHAVSATFVERCCRCWRVDMLTVAGFFCGHWCTDRNLSSDVASRCTKNCFTEFSASPRSSTKLHVVSSRQHQQPTRWCVRQSSSVKRILGGVLVWNKQLK